MVLAYLLEGIEQAQSVYWVTWNCFPQ